jgi:hypothetical protein
MSAKTRYIIVLDPSSSTYLLSWDVPAESVLKPWPVVKATPTTDKAEALRFDSFQDAMDVAQDIRGWGGTQRVETVTDVAEPAVTASLATPDERLEARDAASAAWHECADDDCASLKILHVADTMRYLGFRCTENAAAIASAGALPAVYLTDADGRILHLTYDPMQDGFSYGTEHGDATCGSEPLALSDDEIGEAIADINAVVRENLVSETGDFPPSVFTLRLTDWVAELERIGCVEVSGFATRSGRSYVINRAYKVDSENG